PRRTGRPGGGQGGASGKDSPDETARRDVPDLLRNGGRHHGRRARDVPRLLWRAPRASARPEHEARMAPPRDRERLSEPRAGDSRRRALAGGRGEEGARSLAADSGSLRAPSPRPPPRARSLHDGIVRHEGRANVQLAHTALARDGRERTGAPDGGGAAWL